MRSRIASLIIIICEILTVLVFLYMIYQSTIFFVYRIDKTSMDTTGRIFWVSVYAAIIYALMGYIKWAINVYGDSLKDFNRGKNAQKRAA